MTDIWIICGFLLSVLICVSAYGPDPWDQPSKVKIQHEIQENDHCNNNQSNDNCYTFYKRMLQILVNRGRFQKMSDGIVQGNLHYEFTSSEFELLQKYSQLTVSLTPKEFREIDGLLAENLILPSKLQIYSENSFEFLCNKITSYYIPILIFIGICVCIYCLRFINWSLIFSIKCLSIILFFACVVWECTLEYEKANNEVYSAVNYHPWWKFWESNNEINLDNIKSLTEIFHPINILGNISKKVIFLPLQGFLDFLDKYAEQISGKFPAIISSGVYMLISFVNIVIMMSVSFSVLFYLIFGATIKLSYFGFITSISKGSNNTHTHSANNNSNTNNSIRDTHFNKLLDMCSKLIDHVPEPRPLHIEPKNDFQRSSNEVRVFRKSRDLNKQNFPSISEESNLRQRSMSLERNAKL